MTGRTEKQAEPYRCASCEKPDLILDENFPSFYQARPHLDPDLAQHSYTSAMFYAGLLEHQGLMLHSSAVVVDGKAYLFSALSGTGKSTHTNLWLEHFGDRAYILNDDKPALRIIDGVWHACGTPWSGKHDMSKPVCVPLQGIAMLNRSEINRVERHTGTAAVFDLLEQTIRPSDKLGQLLELLDKLVSNIPVWKLYCNMDPEAALVSYKAMSGTEKE